MWLRAGPGPEVGGGGGGGQRQEVGKTYLATGSDWLADWNSLYS